MLPNPSRARSAAERRWIEEQLKGFARASHPRGQRVQRQLLRQAEKPPFYREVKHHATARRQARDELDGGVERRPRKIRRHAEPGKERRLLLLETRRKQSDRRATAFRNPPRRTSFPAGSRCRWRTIGRASTPAWPDDPPRTHAARGIGADCGRRTYPGQRPAPRIAERRVRRRWQADPRRTGCARPGTRAALARRAAEHRPPASDSPLAIATASGSSKTLGWSSS